MKPVDCAYRFRFYPTPEQESLLVRTFGCVRVVYNKALSYRQGEWNSKRQKVNFNRTSEMLTALKKHPDYIWLSEVPAVPLQQCLRHLDKAYRGFFKKRTRYPQFRSKDDRQTAEFTRSAFNYKPGRLKLAKMDQPLNVVWSRDLPCTPTSITVIRELDDRWYISCRITAWVQPTDAACDAVGVDLGLKDLAILSTGEKIANPRHFARHQKRLAAAQRRMSRKQKGSKNRAKARLKVARAHSAVRHARQDFLHKLSTRLVRENQTICVENLSVKGMLRSKRHSRSVADAGWGELVRQLTYKAMWHGRKLVKIDRFYPSTKTCSVCGTTGHALKLDDREWTCPDCGTHHDRDINAARNILAAGMAVTACGEGVSPGALRHPGLPSAKQEPAP